jgi:hypothetical protein
MLRPYYYFVLHAMHCHPFTIQSNMHAFGCALHVPCIMLCMVHSIQPVNPNTSYPSFIHPARSKFQSEEQWPVMMMHVGAA